MHFFQSAQRAQTRVENIIGLHIAQLKACLQRLFRLVFLADDADHFIQMQEDQQHAGQNFQAMLDFRQAVARTAQQNFAAMVEPLAQSFRQRNHARHDAINQHIHIHREARFQLRIAEQAFHHDHGINRARLGLKNDAHIFSRFIANIAQKRQLLVIQKLGDLFDQSRLLHAIGNFGDNRHPDATRTLFLFPFCAHTERAATRAIGLGNALRLIDNNAPRRKIRTRHKSQQLISRSFGVRDQI